VVISPTINPYCRSLVLGWDVERRIPVGIKIGRDINLRNFPSAGSMRRLLRKLLCNKCTGIKVTETDKH